MILNRKRVLCILCLGILAGCQVNRVSSHADAHGLKVKPILNQQTTKCLKSDGVSHEQLVSALLTLQMAIQNNDPHQVALLVHYPVRVNSIKNKQHVSRLIKNAEQFVQEWPTLLSHSVKQKIIEINPQDSNQMICNWQGISFADGAVWFFADHSAKIYVINNI